MEQVKTTTEQVRKLYNEVPYSAYGMDCFPVIKSLRLTPKQLPEWGRDKSVLEVGCGAGHIICYLAGFAHKATGVDISSKSLELARKKSAELGVANVDFLQADFFDEEFLKQYEASFDYILCYGVLHHTNNPYLGFTNLLRLLKPGAQITVGLYSRTELVYRIKRKIVLWLAGKDWGKRERWANRLYFKGQGDKLRIFDSYVHPVVSFHSIAEIFSWGEKNNLAYVGSWPPIEFFYYFKIFKKPFPPANEPVKIGMLKKIFFWLVELIWILSGKSVMVSLTFKKL